MYVRESSTLSSGSYSGPMVVLTQARRLFNKGAVLVTRSLKKLGLRYHTEVSQKLS
jgi:hypothetical protein